VATVLTCWPCPPCMRRRSASERTQPEPVLCERRRFCG
jgi:hypothetical protein